jgi:hypothetical protein
MLRLEKQNCFKYQCTNYYVCFCINYWHGFVKWLKMLTRLFNGGRINTDHHYVWNSCQHHLIKLYMKVILLVLVYIVGWSSTLHQIMNPPCLQRQQKLSMFLVLLMVLEAVLNQAWRESLRYRQSLMMGFGVHLGTVLVILFGLLRIQSQRATRHR